MPRCFSCTEGSSAPDTTPVPGPAPRERGRLQRTHVLIELHLDAAARRAVPDRALRTVRHAAEQHTGHREHLRTRRSPALQRGRVGAQHPLLSRAAGD